MRDGVTRTHALYTHGRATKAAFRKNALTPAFFPPQEADVFSF